MICVFQPSDDMYDDTESEEEIELEPIKRRVFGVIKQLVQPAIIPPLLPIHTSPIVTRKPLITSPRVTRVVTQPMTQTVTCIPTPAAQTVTRVVTANVQTVRCVSPDSTTADYPNKPYVRFQVFLCYIFVKNGCFL